MIFPNGIKTIPFKTQYCSSFYQCKTTTYKLVLEFPRFDCRNPGLDSTHQHFISRSLLWFQFADTNYSVKNQLIGS